MELHFQNSELHIHEILKLSRFMEEENWHSKTFCKEMSNSMVSKL
jgi:hypothetical protein